MTNRPARLKALCADLVECADRHGTMKLVLWVASFGSERTPRLGGRKLAGRLGVSENTARDAIEEAVRKGWIELVPDGNSNRYRLAGAWLKTHQKVMRSDNDQTRKTASRIDAFSLEPTPPNAPPTALETSAVETEAFLSDALKINAVSAESASKVAAVNLTDCGNVPEVASTSDAIGQNVRRTASTSDAVTDAVPGGESANAARIDASADAVSGGGSHVDRTCARGDQSPLLVIPKEQEESISEGVGGGGSVAVPKPKRSRKTHPTTVVDFEAMGADERELCEKIVRARWRQDNVPPEQLALAAEVAAWLVRERAARPADFDRWLGWWYRHPDSMASRNPTKPWPKNVRSTWDTCFDGFDGAAAVSAERLTPAQREAREMNRKLQEELEKEVACVRQSTVAS